MKKNNYFILAAISIVLTTSFLGCQKDVAVTSVTLDQELRTLLVGENETLLATVSPKTATNKTIMWSSANTNIASVNATGTVTARAVGSTTITATSADGGITATCHITVYTTEYHLWGLGEKLTQARSNNVNYEWYIDQVNTGTYSYSNCGPASVTMAIKWANPNFTGTAEGARNTYRSDGGWWYTSDIMNYLTANNTSFSTYTFTPTSLVSLLNSGNIAILCLDMYYVRHLSEPAWYRIDKFYVTENPEWGHFIVVKGYKIVDGIIWFEVYDPWSLNVTYSDGSLKGRDRYYRGEDIILATDVWWKYMIVINTPASTRTKAIEIDPSTIVHQWGR